MATLRTFKAIENDVYVLRFEVDLTQLGEDDKKRMQKFGEPQINVGGTYIGGGEVGDVTVASGIITAIAVDEGGNNYPEAPTVTITDSTGSGATATATITDGVITAITVVDGGTGYSDSPTVTLSEPDNIFTLPDENVRIRSGFPIRKEFDSTAAPFDEETLTKVNTYKTAIQEKWQAAITALRAEVDSFTGEEVTEV